MHYVFGSGDGYAMPLAVGLRSLADVAPGSQVTVLSDGITAANQARIAASCVELSVEFLDVTQMLPDGLPLSSYITRSTYARLFAASLVRGDRLVFLDCDIVVVEDPSPLFGVDLRGAIIAAARDVDSPVASCPGGIAGWREAGVDAQLPLYNAGVLVIDCAAWEQSGATNRVLDFVRTHPGTRFADQDGINVGLAGEITPIALRWNAQPPLRRASHLGYVFFDAQDVDEAIRTPGIIHYAEGTKPWHQGSADPAAAVWRSIVQRTAWAGWEPPKGRSLAARGIGAARRAVGSRNR